MTPTRALSGATDGVGHHQLFEWEARRFDAIDGIPADEAERLVRAAQAPAARLTGNQSAFDFGRETLRAQNLVGMVVAGSASCEILPKVDRDATDDAPMLRRQLIGMLAVAHDLPIADDAATTLDTQHQTLLEILISRFCAVLGEAVRRGVPRFYVGHVDDLTAMRGRLDIGRQFTALAASPQRLACRYDEFSEDIALNQVMKAAVARLAQLARTTPNRRALSELALVYVDVSTVSASVLRWDTIVPDRSNARWQGLVRLAKLILGDRFQNSAHGGADGFALLFDMNVLFERYVEKLLGRLAPAYGWRLTAQGGARRCLHPEDESDALFSTSPDIQLARGGKVGAVLDTKWKRLADQSRDRKMDISQDDIYQLMAYAQLYECEQLVLLYPHHGGLISPLPIHHRIARRHGSVRLTIATVDVTRNEAAQTGLAALLDAMPS